MKFKNFAIFVLILAILAGLTAWVYYGIPVNGVEYGKYTNIKQGLDLKGGVYIVYEADEELPENKDMETAISIIQSRLDYYNWTEAEVAKEGVNRIRVEIPGVDDAQTAVNEIGSAAHLTFVDQEGNVVVDGANVVDATAAYSNSQYCVSLEFDSVGKEAFAEATANNIGNPIYIMMDEMVISAPNVESAITDGKAVITGSFDEKGAQDLAAKIRGGKLPFNLNVIDYSEVGARLGADSLRTSVFAGVIGVVAVLVFMLLFYRVSGIASDIALCIYTCLVLIVMSVCGLTLTLPGVAGIVLSIGMAVDANVIIFERIKEEINAGRTVKNAIKTGFSRALPAIFDGNVTTLIACIVLLWLGSGTVKGFAQTLMIGIILSMFTAIFVTRIIINCLVGMGLKNPKLYGGK